MWKPILKYFYLLLQVNMIVTVPNVGGSQITVGSYSSRWKNQEPPEKGRAVICTVAKFLSYT